ncbi:DUF1573 domain-containing protein [Maribacter aquivivus]|uniref:DUF1573 domain-containing protein n=1 Tax=Maribacter aquivivus TaxID=228958 RepID=UPI0024932476|nr:DUF1573 domain-containing protein [Maribacter aquivivus]
MKMISKIILSLLFLTTILSCNQSNDNTTISFEKTDYDFGEIAADENVSLLFRFSNTGEAPLIIKNITTSCGCTVPEWNKKSIMKDEESEIKVDIHPTGPGIFNSSLTVFYNSDNSPQTLRIKGVVEYLSLLDK